MKYFEFQSVLFNFHDVILIMTTLQCLFFAGLLYVSNTRNSKSVKFLALFLLAHALFPLNELFLWGAEFKYIAQSLWPDFYFVPGVAYYLDAVLLYLCIKFLVFKGVTLKKIDMLHLIPVLIYILYITSMFGSQSFDERQQMLLSNTYVYSSTYISIEWFSKLIRVGYCVACFIMLVRYYNLLKDQMANIEKGHIHWLKSLVVGFMLVMFGESVLISMKALNMAYPISGSVFEYLGLTVNYANFVLVNLLFFLAVRDFFTFEQMEEYQGKTLVDESIVNPKMAQEVDNAMLNNKAYLDPDITLDKLAECLAIPARDLSMLINRHLGVNFYEFINKYRIDEAKRLLVADEHKNTTITDIYFLVGFNSKSVFYTFFKKFENTTPSQYRKQYSQT